MSEHRIASKDCPHDGLFFERDTLNDGWIKLKCRYCSAEGDFMLSREGALASFARIHKDPPSAAVSEAANVDIRAEWSEGEDPDNWT
jgi:hypothetical protein